MRRTTCLLLALLSAGAAAQSALRPRYGGVLRIQVRGTLQSLDPGDTPDQAPGAGIHAKVAAAVFETLVRLDGEGRPQPGLASSWEPDAPRNRWRFVLREGVRFHDGSPLTAESAAASLAVRNPQWQVKPEGKVIVIWTDGPSPELPEELSLARNAILLREATGKLLGTGPFVLSGWQAGRSIVLSANEDYWGGRPFLDGVEIELGHGSRERLLGLELERADLIDLGPDEVRRAAERQAEFWTSSPVELVALVFEPARPAVEDARVREAIALSIDRAAMHAVLLQKQGESAGSLLPQWMTGYAFLFPPARDLARSRERVSALPAKAREVTLGCAGCDPLASSIAERVALNAKEAGLVVRVAVRAGPADLRLVHLRVASPIPSIALSRLVASLRGSEILPALGEAGLESVHSAEATLLKDLRVIPLFHLPELYASAKRVQRHPVPSGPDGGWRLEDLWLSGEGR